MCLIPQHANITRILSFLYEFPLSMSSIELCVLSNWLLLVLWCPVAPFIQNCIKISAGCTNAYIHTYIVRLKKDRIRPLYRWPEGQCTLGRHPEGRLFWQVELHNFDCWKVDVPCGFTQNSFSPYFLMGPFMYLMLILLTTSVKSMNQQGVIVRPMTCLLD